MLKDYTQEDLELMSYDDIAYLLLEEGKKPEKIVNLFKNIIKVLKLNEEYFDKHLADFFEILSTDKRFIVLEKGTVDLRIRHSNKVIIDEEEDDSELEDEEIEDDIDESDEDELFDDERDPEDDEPEDDLKSLIIIDEKDEE